MIVTLLTDVNGSDKTTAIWANEYGLSYPVVDDAGAQITNSFGTGGYYPNMHLLGPGMEVIVPAASGDTKLSKADIETYLSQLN